MERFKDDTMKVELLGILLFSLLVALSVITTLVIAI